MGDKCGLRYTQVWTSFPTSTVNMAGEYEITWATAIQLTYCGNLRSLQVILLTSHGTWACCASTLFDRLGRSMIDRGLPPVHQISESSRSFASYKYITNVCHYTTVIINIINRLISSEKVIRRKLGLIPTELAWAGKPRSMTSYLSVVLVVTSFFLCRSWKIQK